MAYLIQRQRLQHLLYMLKKHQLVIAAGAAITLNCSVRTVKSCIERLRKYGRVIKYQRKLKRYVLIAD